MCDVQKGVCTCIGRGCPVLAHVKITDKQKAAAEERIESGACSCLCTGLVEIGVIPENTRDHIVATYQLKREAKVSYIPRTLRKLASSAKEVTSAAVDDFLSAAENFTSENEES